MWIVADGFCRHYSLFRWFWTANFSIYIEKVLKLAFRRIDVLIYCCVELEFSCSAVFKAGLSGSLRSIFVEALSALSCSEGRLHSQAALFYSTKWLLQSSHHTKHHCVHRREEVLLSMPKKLESQAKLWLDHVGHVPSMCWLLQAEAHHSHGVSRFMLYWGMWAMWIREGYGNKNLGGIKKGD